MLLDDWCERGLKIVVITQQIELNGAVGRMIAAVMLGLAEIELEYRRQRQMAGIEVAREGDRQDREISVTAATDSSCRCGIRLAMLHRHHVVGGAPSSGVDGSHWKR